MSKLTIGSIVTATLLLVGCGGSGSSSSSNPTTNNETGTKIGKGYYVDAAVEGVEFQCGNQSGTTDVNGTFTFENGSDCNFTVGGIPLRDVNASSLEDNVTILEENTTVAQLLQTLDSDGNASNGIHISQGAKSVIKETLSSLEEVDQDLLEAVHNRLKAEHSDEYNGRVVDKNQTIEHLNETKNDVENRGIRTNLDVEEENRSRRENNSADRNENGQREDNSADRNENAQREDNSADRNENGQREEQNETPRGR